MTPVATPKVFISYRREETAGHAGRLYDEIVERLGEGNVFMDVDLAPGIDFVDRITTAVGGCRALLVVMGPRWATGTGESREPRIADPQDFVRLEVETALQRPDVAVIPVLVAGARMPQAEQLPEPLRPLARRNAIELSDQRWRYDVGRLLDAVGGLLGTRRDDDVVPVRRIGPAQVLEGSALAAIVAWLMLMLVEGINSADRPEESAKIATTVVRNGIAWAVVGLALAAWWAWRRGERGIAGAAIAGLLLGALGGALGSAIFALAKFTLDASEDVLKTVSVGSLAVLGGSLGLMLGRACRPPRGSFAAIAGIAAGALVQLVLVGLDAPAKPTDALEPHDALIAGVQAAAIAAGVLAALVATAQRRPASAEQPTR